MIGAAVSDDFRRGFCDAARVLGRRWPPLAAATALGLLLAVAALEARAGGGGGSAQLQLLQGVAFGIVLPLYALATSARIGGRREQLMPSRWVREGGDRRVYALGRLALGAAHSGLAAGVLGALALALGGATGGPEGELPASLGNLLSVIWIGVLGGIGYTAALALALELAGTPGRLLLLAADWVLGSGTSLLALPWPRAHLRALLGGAAPLEIAPSWAALCLAAIGAAAAFAYVRRLPR